MEWDNQHWEPEPSGIPCTQGYLHQRTPVIKCSSVAWDPNWLPGSTAPAHPGPSRARMESGKAGICQQLSSWKAQRPPTAGIARLRRGKREQPQDSKEVKPGISFPGREETELRGEPSVTAGL